MTPTLRNGYIPAMATSNTSESKAVPTLPEPMKMDHESGSVDRVTVRVPPFWPEEPALWFASLEAQLHLAGVTREGTMFYHTVAQLDTKSAIEVKDLITSPPKDNPYSALKTALIARFSESQEEKVRRLLEKEELGDRKPSTFLRYLKNLAGTSVPDTLLRTLWMGRLPVQTQAILATQSETSLDSLAVLADKIHEITPAMHVSATSLAGSSRSPDNSSASSLECQIQALTKQVAALTTRLDRGLSRARNRSRSRSKSRQRKGQCWYHDRFKDRAQKCIKPCSYEGNQPTSH